jgi:hypothetical protein
MVGHCAGTPPPLELLAATKQFSGETLGHPVVTSVCEPFG